MIMAADSMTAKTGFLMDRSERLMTVPIQETRWWGAVGLA
jgi:hypothetical protein